MEERSRNAESAVSQMQSGDQSLLLSSDGAGGRAVAKPNGCVDILGADIAAEQTRAMEQQARGNRETHATRNDAWPAPAFQIDWPYVRERLNQPPAAGACIRELIAHAAKILGEAPLHRPRQASDGLTMALLCPCLLVASLSWQAGTGPAIRSPLATPLVASRSTPLVASASVSSPWLVPLQNALLPKPKEDVSIVVRKATAGDALDLARLCTDCFFGEHKASDGPIIFVQRSVIYSRVLQQVLRRISIDEGRECMLLVAADAKSGRVNACVDVAIHLFDKELQRFELMIDEMPYGREARRRYAWRPYVASLAVDGKERRRGLGRRLMREAERTARGWGYRELMLEVAFGNEGAVGFYERCGYRIIGEDVKGTGATVVRVVNGLYWSVDNVEKLLMRRTVF